MADEKKKSNKGTWEKGDLEVVKLVINGKVVKQNKDEKKAKKKQ